MHKLLIHALDNLENEHLQQLQKQQAQRVPWDPYGSSYQNIG